MTFQVQHFGLSDRGKKRASNQDHFLSARLSKSLVVAQSNLHDDVQSQIQGQIDGYVFLVADGIGGHAGGELASEVVIRGALTYIQTTLPWFYRLNTHHDDDFREELKKALEFCQDEIHAEAEAEPVLRDMGTTLTMAYLLGHRLYVVHVGDSRCYLFRNGRLHQITRDHTLAQMLVEEGQLSPKDVERSPLSHVLWNAVGGAVHTELKPDVYKSGLSEEDQILLCSDGLTRHVDDEGITAILNGELNLAEKCQQLIDAANQRGGSDNITVLLIQISG